MNPNHATLTVTKETRRRLYEGKGVVTTYDEFISQLLDEHEERMKSECSCQNNSVNE